MLEETPPYTPSTVPGLQRLNQVHDHITLLSVHVAFSDQSLNLATDESYELQVCVRSSIDPTNLELSRVAAACGHDVDSGGPKLPSVPCCSAQNL